MNVFDRWSGLFWLGISIFVCIKSIQVGVGTFRSPGSGFLPFWAGGVFGLLALILVVSTLVSRKQAVKGISLWKEVQWPKVLLVLASLYLYALFLQKIGYLPMTFALMLLLFGLTEGTKWWLRFLSSLITVSASYLVFHVLLEVQLPKGIVPF
ncbi:MAG: hypothetical protein A2170_11675 [Deltaproteobacteria bacterium RBG_13_53_10]|nr:MAG: hypothetical protein A2170_11675 [Deltaproteobacteria bacterium RBG_13_53_10]